MKLTHLLTANQFTESIENYVYDQMSTYDEIRAERFDLQVKYKNFLKKILRPEMFVNTYAEAKPRNEYALSYDDIWREDVNRYLLVEFERLFDVDRADRKNYEFQGVEINLNAIPTISFIHIGNLEPVYTLEDLAHFTYGKLKFKKEGVVI